MFLRFDGAIFKDQPTSNHPHEAVGPLSIYKGSPFVTGGSNNRKTEILDFESNQWIIADDYPTFGQYR